MWQLSAAAEISCQLGSGQVGAEFLDKKAAFTSIPADRLTIVPVSEWIRGEMQSSFLKDCRFQVIHNGIDLNVFDIYDTEAVKAKYGLQGKRILLGVASIWSRERLG